MSNKFTFLSLLGYYHSNDEKTLNLIAHKNRIKLKKISWQTFWENPAVIQLSDPVITLENNMECLQELKRRYPDLRIVNIEQSRHYFLGINSVSFNIEDYAMRICRHLMQSGKKRATLFASCYTRQYVKYHIEAFRRATMQYGIELRDEDIFWDKSCTAIECWDEIKPRLGKIDAVICNNDQNAVFACKAAAESGFAVPWDIAITGRGQTCVSRITRPTITTSLLDREELYNQVIKLCMYLYREPTIQTLDVTINHPLAIGESSDINVCSKKEGRPNAISYKQWDPHIFGKVEHLLKNSGSMTLSVVQKLIAGKTNQEIANELFVEERSVAYHIKKIKTILCVSSKKDIVDAFLQLNIT